MSTHVRNLYQKSKQLMQNDRGQGLVEYALILVLIAIVVIAAVSNVGHSTSNAFQNINSSLNK